MAEVIFYADAFCVWMAVRSARDKRGGVSKPREYCECVILLPSAASAVGFERRAEPALLVAGVLAGAITQDVQVRSGGNECPPPR